MLLPLVLCGLLLPLMALGAVGALSGGLSVVEGGGDGGRGREEGFGFRWGLISVLGSVVALDGDEAVLVVEMAEWRRLECWLLGPVGAFGGGVEPRLAGRRSGR